MATQPNAEVEKSIFSAFVVASKRPRYLELLNKPKQREKLLRALAHFSDWDPKCLREIPPSQHFPQPIFDLLRGFGASTNCYVISENENRERTQRDLS